DRHHQRRRRPTALGRERGPAHPGGDAPGGRRARPPVGALHPPLGVRARRVRAPGCGAGDRLRGGGADHRRPRAHLPRRALGPVRRPGRPRPARARRGRREAGRDPGLLPAVVLRHPARDRPRGTARGPRAGRPGQGLLHHRRRRGRRDGVEAGQAVLQAHRPPRQDQGDQPGGGVPRHPAGRPVDHGHPQRQGAVRAAGAGHVPGAEHQPVPGARAPARRRQGLRALGRRPHRGGHPLRGRRHRRGRLPRAGAELRRLLPAAARVLRAGARDLRRARRPAGLRRGDLRVRADRLDVRLRRPRLRARHDHVREGDDVGLLPHRRVHRQRPAVRAVPPRRHHVRARLHLRRAPRLRGRGHGQPRPLRARGPQRPRQGARAGVPPDAGEAAGPAHRRRRARRGVLLRHRAGQGPGHPRDLHRRGGRAAAARVPLPRAVRGGPVLPRRRPRRPGGAAGAAAGLRAGGVRRDRAGAALGAHPGPGAAV
ncbi:MAG: Omega-amino acid--pyruvate aminotransferase, partial [uncultured Quadrisphaera sp.]